MKKILIAVFVAAVSLSANAQVWVSGQLGVNTSKESFDGHTTYKGNNFTIAPEIGYKLSDNIDVALQIGYAHAKSTVDDVNVISNKFMVFPYVRYTFATSGNFSFFVDGGFGYALTHYCGNDKSTNTWEIALKPGVSYALSEKFGLVAHVGYLGWGFEKYDKKKTNNIGLNADLSTISFGGYINL